MSAAINRSSCSQLELACAFALEALPANELPGVRAHISECAICQQAVESLRPVIDSFAHWPTDVLRPPRSLWQRLSRRIDAQLDDTSSEPQAVEPAWAEAAPGISCKLLATDTQRHRVSMLVRLAPGVDYPPHRHAGVEELHLLHGELWINDRKLYPGEYSRAEPGTADERVWSETGCTCVLMTSTRDTLG